MKIIFTKKLNIGDKDMTDNQLIMFLVFSIVMVVITAIIYSRPKK